MADIDLTIKYTDTGTKKLEADLERLKQDAIKLQKKFDNFSLTKLKNDFSDFGRVARTAFGKGLQSRITAVTRKITGQNAAVKALIAQYRILNGVMLGGGGPGGLAAQMKKGLMGKGGQTAADTYSGPGRPLDKYEQHARSRASRFDDWKKTTNIVPPGDRGQWYAEDPRKLRVLERRAKMTKDILGNEMSIAAISKKYGVSQTTARRDKKIIEATAAERKLLASAAHPTQIATAQPVVRPTKQQMKEMRQAAFPAQYGTTSGFTAPRPQVMSLDDEIRAGQRAMERNRPADIQRQARESRGQAFQRTAPIGDAYRSLGQYTEVPDKTYSRHQPSAPVAQTSVKQLEKVAAKSKIVSEDVNSRLRRMWDVPDATEKITKPLVEAQKTTKKAVKDLSSTTKTPGTYMDKLGSAITRAKGKLGGLAKEFDDLGVKRKEAFGKSDTKAVDAYGKRMNENIAQQGKLEKAIKRMRATESEGIKKVTAQKQKAATKEGGWTKARAEASKKNMAEALKNQEALNLVQGKPQVDTGKKAQQNAQQIHNAAQTEKRANKTKAKSAEDYANRYINAQGRVAAARMKGQRALGLMSRTDPQFDPTALAVARLRAIEQGLGSKEARPRTDALNKYKKESKELFDTIDKGSKRAKKSMGFMNSAFAKFSIAMSGIAATLFVWQQVSAAIGAVIRHGTKLETTFIKVQDRFQKTAAQMQMLKESAMDAGETGVVTAAAYTELVAQFEAGGYTAAKAIETVNAAIEHERKLLEGTVSGELNEFFGLMRKIGTIGFARTSDSFYGFLEGVNSQIQKIVNSKSDLEAVLRMMEGAAKVQGFFGGDPIVDAIKEKSGAASFQEKAIQRGGELIGIEGAKEWGDIYTDMILDTWKKFDWLGNKIVGVFTDIGDAAIDGLNIRGPVDTAVNKLRELYSAVTGHEFENATMDMWKYGDSLAASAKAARDLADAQQMAKQLPKDLQTAFRATGQMPISMYLDKTKQKRLTLQNLRDVLDDEAFKKAKMVIDIEFQAEQDQFKLKDYQKFYATIGRYSKEHYDMEMQRIGDAHKARMERAQTPEQRSNSAQIAQKEFYNINQRNIRSFMAQEERMLGLIGKTSGRTVEVGIKFDPNTGEQITSEFMDYLQILEYRTEKSVEHMNAMFGTIGSTLGQGMARDFDAFESKGGERITKAIKAASRKTGVDPYLLEQIGKQESGNFRPDIVSGKRLSSKGAIGPMQLMPDTAKELGVDPFNLEENIMGGADYFKQQLDKFSGDLKLALAAYNAGPHRVEQYGNNVPPFKETQDYVAKITQGYGATRMRTPRAPQPMGVSEFGPRMAEVQAGPAQRPDNRLQQQFREAQSFKNQQKLQAFNIRAYKNAYDRLGLMTQEHYDNELAIIANFESQNKDILGDKYAKKIADKARFNLEWKKKTADELKISQDGIRMLEQVFSETDIYSPKLQQKGQLKIQETEARLDRIPGMKQSQKDVQTQTMKLAEFEKANKLRVNVDQAYFDKSKEMTDFLYEYKKSVIYKEVELAMSRSDGTINAEQLLNDKLRALEDERGQHRVDAWAAMYESTGKYSDGHLQHEMENLARIRDENIRITGDIDQAWETYRRGKTELQIEVLLKSEDAMDGLEALKKQVSLDSESMAQAINKNVGTIISGTKDNLETLFFDSMQVNFDNVWDLFSSTADRFKEMIDRMVSDYLASQLAKGLFGDMFDAGGGSGGGLMGGLLDMVVGGFTGMTGGGGGGGGGSTLSRDLGKIWATGLAKGGVISKAMTFTDQQVINKGHTFRRESSLGLAKGGIIPNRMRFYGNDGDYMTRLGTGGVITAAMMAPAGRTGGVEIGEKGPEVIMPIARTKSGKMGVQIEGSGGQKITNNFNINVSAPNGRLDPQSMSQIQTKLGMAVNRSLRRNG